MKGGFPEYITKIMIPTAKRSVWIPVYVPSSTSGGLYPYVPTRECKKPSPLCPVLKVESPKSETFKIKSLSKRMFYGFKSLCETPTDWR